MSRRSKRAQSKAWLSSISPVSKIKSRPPDTPAVHHPNQPIISDTMVAPHSSQQTAPDTAGTSHLNQLIILDTLAAPQQVVLETHTSSVTNVGTAPFANASNIVLNNPTFNDIQVPPDQVASAMKALSKRAIDGAEHDSSARDPPPSCHPGTRVQLLEKIKAWFYDKMKEKALLWLSGPAGVGKSAVIQTFAEALAESKSLGAALFFSRLNDRKDPQRVVATLSFQLATRVPAYKTYIVEQITLDPSLLRKGLKEQFQIFIAEPFGNKGIGKGEGPWGILLDGLDECEGVDQQREIVRLVSEFILRFPDVPLVWSIASRPEPHIVAAFTSSAVAPSHWSEYVPIDSSEGCRDVERYLNNSFESMRNQFPHVPLNWPKETQFLKLSNGAKGLFVFARTAVRFMEDPNHANPVSRLNLVLSVIDRSNIAVTGENPFALLDALYNYILISIPSSVWPTTKRTLGFFICARPRNHGTFNEHSYSLDSRSLKAASIILNIEQHDVYGSLHKLHSVLEILHSDIPDKPGVSFFHASFGDYLTDPVRSKGFYIDRGESVDDIAHGLFRVYMEMPWDNHCTSQLPRIAGDTFHQQLQKDALTGLYHAVTGVLRSGRGRGPFTSEGDRSKCLDFLGQADVSALSRSQHGFRFVQWLFRLWDAFPYDLQSRGLVEEVPLQKVSVDHLQYEDHTRIIIEDPSSLRAEHDYVNDPSFISSGYFMVVFRSLQLRHPEKGALICGNSLRRRYAFIQDDQVLRSTEGFYYFPYSLN